ncbi:hypothetical protein NL676_036202 [Syzygium grande]|nr:hypothetical protein NL676_036202 [Syzygium grande]
MSSCQIDMLPDKFYNKMEEGSILIKRSPSFHFCREGLIVRGEDKLIPSDLVPPDIKAIRSSRTFSDLQSFKSTSSLHQLQPFLFTGDSSPDSPACNYRICRGPCKPTNHGEQMTRLMHLLDSNIKLWSIRAMEKDTARWEIHMKQHGGRNFWR